MSNLYAEIELDDIEYAVEYFIEPAEKADMYSPGCPREVIIEVVLLAGAEVELTNEIEAALIKELKKG